MKLSEKIWSATMLLDGPNNCGIPLESMKELYTLARECECNVDIMHDRIAALEAELDEAKTNAEMINRRCDTCQWWIRTLPFDLGECRFNPPIYRLSGIPNKHSRGVFALTKNDDWCSQHVTK